MILKDNRKKVKYMNKINEYELQANVCGQQITVPVTVENEKDKRESTNDIFKSYAAKLK